MTELLLAELLTNKQTHFVHTVACNDVSVCHMFLSP